MIQHIGILGAGAWGTALAQQARRAGRDVILQAHEPEVVQAITREHENKAYLPDVALDPAIEATGDLARTVNADAVLLAVPAQFLRRVLGQVAHAWRPGVPALICAKGVEEKTGATMAEVVAEALPGAEVGVLTGPSFAREVALGLPTAITLAMADAALCESLAQALGTPTFRIYLTDDVAGTQIGGAVKNVLAIACGIVEGRRLGDNARAALITRGLAEMTRLARARGARAETLMGLSGLGDLVLTCSAMQSRNFSLGVALGQGTPLSDILASRTSVAEGVFTAAAAVTMADKLGIEMPIASAVDAVLNHGADLDETIAGLLARPFRTEAAAG